MRIAAFIIACVVALIGVMLVLTTDYSGTGLLLAVGGMIGAVCTDPAQQETA